MLNKNIEINAVVAIRSVFKMRLFLMRFLQVTILRA